MYRENYPVHAVNTGQNPLVGDMEKPQFEITKAWQIFEKWCLTSNTYWFEHSDPVWFRQVFQGISYTTDPGTGRDSTRAKLSDSPQPKRGEPRENGSKENRDSLVPLEIPRATVPPLALVKPRPSTISPMAAPLATPAFKDCLPPCSPGPKSAGCSTPSSAASFWSSMPGSPASRPGSFTFPGDASDTLSRQSQNQNHRHSTHSKDADRMSTCSSTSEQSVQSTQSNGVRALLHPKASVHPPVQHKLYYSYSSSRRFLSLLSIQVLTY